jgi:tRNA threonylcarbamoyladenosine modification (KEOPS) complex  Pcc1 subunit
MFQSKIEIKGKKELLEAYKVALEPEQNFETQRAGYKLKPSKDKLTINITAKDATSFRAVNSTLTGLMSIVWRVWKLKNETRSTSRKAKRS